MTLRLSATIARHRRPILITAALVVTAVVAARALGADPDLLAPWLFLILLGTGLLHLVTLAAPSVRRRPAAFEVDHEAVHTPRTGTVVLGGVAHLAALGLTALFPDETTPMGVPFTPATAVLFAGFALYWRALWYGVRLTLTPDGLRNEKYAGTVTIPWPAVSAPHPTDSTPLRLRLTLTRPDVVEVTGWTTSRRTLEFDGVPVPFVAAAIQHQLNHPDQRATLGAGAAGPRTQTPPGTPSPGAAAR
ncbi:hypothetical protein [Actinoplanes sp. DH11]|uniref:hypothetical protein n=1 Tax=Actinoplanes sp. DH11 TaxID=2857011 RepID=UPI001E422A45|nr:hypothetical protein [Actinoplanes sp. DH11]